jgi:hypothetical protein
VCVWFSAVLKLKTECVPLLKILTCLELSLLRLDIHISLNPQSASCKALVFFVFNETIATGGVHTAVEH